MEVVKGPDNKCNQEIEELIALYQTSLLRLCYIQLQDRALAEDAVQETFLKAFRSFSAFRGDCSRKTWLVRIAMNTCRDMRRAAWFRHMDRRVTPDMLPQPAVYPESQDQDLTLAVMNLPAKLREAIILYYYQDMSTQEIAQALNITQPSVAGRLKRGREKLRAALEGRELDE